MVEVGFFLVAVGLCAIGTLIIHMYRQHRIDDAVEYDDDKTDPQT